ncbi:MAG: hypothetical protein PHX68_03735 [Alphaproteobacteria bacterium]|nr:hypothetical protein [Alphaproteobacteria bacterium]
MMQKYVPRVAFIGRREDGKAKAPKRGSFWMGAAAACAVLIPLHQFDAYARQLAGLERERQEAYRTATRLFGSSEKALWYYLHRNRAIRKAEENWTERHPHSAAVHRWLSDKMSAPQPQRLTTQNAFPEEPFPSHERIREG